MYLVKQTINHEKMTLAEFDDLAKAENFLNKYVVILKKHDPHLAFKGNQIISHVPVERKIQITKKAD